MANRSIIEYDKKKGIAQSTLGRGPNRPSDPNKLSALVAPRVVTTDEGLNAVMRWGDIVRLPDQLCSSLLIDGPQPRAAVDALFAGGNGFDAFGFDNDDSFTVFEAGGALVSDNRRANLIDCPFLACALCTDIDTDPDAYELTGTAVPIPSGSVPTPALGPAPGPSDPGRPATFRHGIDAWLAKYYFEKAFRARMTLACDFILFDLAMAVLGLCNDDEFNGAGNLLAGAHQDIYRANVHAKAIGQTEYFVPQTAVGPCSPGGAPIPLPEPLAAAMLGSWNFDGSYGGRYPFPKRFPILQLMPFGISYYIDRGSGPFYQRFLDALSLPDPNNLVYAPEFMDTMAENIVVVTVQAGFAITPAIPGAVAILPGGLLPTAAFGTGTSATGALQITTLVDLSIVPIGGGATVTVPAGTVIGTTGLVSGIALPVVAIASTPIAVGWGDSRLYKDFIWRLRTCLCGFKFAPESCFAWFNLFSGGLGPAWANMYSQGGALAGLLANARVANHMAVLAGLTEKMKGEKALAKSWRVRQKEGRLP